MPSLDLCGARSSRAKSTLLAQGQHSPGARPSACCTSGIKDHTAEPTWRLGAIYVGETAAELDYKLATRHFFTLSSATSQGGSGEIEVVGNDSKVLFRQRFVWKFPKDIVTIRSGPYDVELALEGDVATTRGNFVELSSSPADARLTRAFMTPERAARLAQRDIAVSVKPTNRVALGQPDTPTRAKATLSFLSPSSSPAWADLWFTLVLSNNQPGGTQFWQIDYVFLSSDAPADALP